MKLTMPFKLLDWIDDNREHLKPPVCNKQMFESGDFIVGYHLPIMGRLGYGIILTNRNEGELIPLADEIAEVYLD